MQQISTHDSRGFGENVCISGKGFELDGAAPVQDEKCPNTVEVHLIGLNTFGPNITESRYKELHTLHND